MHAYEIDDNGFIIENYTLNGDIPIPEGAITVQLPQPLLFQKPKWNEAEWIEGESQEEREERESQQLLESLKPSAEEINDANLDIKIITLLTELEVI